MKEYISRIIALLFLMIIPIGCYADVVKLQRAVPYGVLSLVFKIQYNNEAGSCFIIDVDNRQYIITARHILPKAKKGDKISIYAGGEWNDFVIEPIYPKDNNIDIVALVADKLITQKMSIKVGAKEMYVGQDVYFLGFPFGLASQVDDPKAMLVPFIKKGILSAIDFRKSAGHVLYIDGHNNPGFSGGPVIFANYDDKEALYIAGVISGYRAAPSIVHEAKERLDTQSFVFRDTNVIHYVNENTGIVIAHSIEHIIKEIKENPIGFQILNK